MITLRKEELPRMIALLTADLNRALEDLSKEYNAVKARRIKSKFPKEQDALDIELEELRQARSATEKQHHLLIEDLKRTAK